MRLCHSIESDSSLPTYVSSVSEHCSSVSPSSLYTPLSGCFVALVIISPREFLIVQVLAVNSSDIIPLDVRNPTNSKFMTILGE